MNPRDAFENQPADGLQITFSYREADLIVQQSTTISTVEYQGYRAVRLILYLAEGLKNGIDVQLKTREKMKCK